MRKAEKTEITINKILNYAIKEFGKNGYTNGTINNICRLGVNKGLIYHNFKDKDELYLVCLEKSWNKMKTYISDKLCTESFLKYMQTRSKFIDEFPNEAYIFFEAILSPPEHLKIKIQEIMQEFEQINEEVYRNTISYVSLRDNVSIEEAIQYFRQMQNMFNAYFNSFEYRSFSLEEKIKIHENNIPQFVNYMLYGIAKGDDSK